MSYATNKQSVINFFDFYVLKYIVTDLKVLDKISADEKGEGGCTIPQAVSTFAALDLIGYLTSSQTPPPIGMHFQEVLQDPAYFPEFILLANQEKFLNSFRDDFRSTMAHRFLLIQYDIHKSASETLLSEYAGRHIFNVSYFTKLVITAIEKIYSLIQSDQFIINGCAKDESVEKIKIRIDDLKHHASKHYKLLEGLPSLTSTPETTRSPSNL